MRRLFSDMSLCTPEKSLTNEFQRGKWQLIDYETEKSLRGTMVSALPEQACGSLELPLNSADPHKIFLGINYTKALYNEWPSYGQLEVKLSGEDGFRRVGAEFQGPHAGHIPNKMGIRNEIYKSVQEAYGKQLI